MTDDEKSFLKLYLRRLGTIDDEDEDDLHRWYQERFQGPDWEKDYKNMVDKAGAYALGLQDGWDDAQRRMLDRS